MDVSSYFRDPDGDALVYSASSTRPGIATASTSESVLTVTGVEPGPAAVTVTAADPDGLTAAQRVAVTVRIASGAPEPVGTIPSIGVAAGESESVDVSSYFRDPDGDALTYSATSSRPGVATASLSGTSLAVTGVAAGSATVTVTAADPDGLTATQRVNVTVRTGNRAPEPVGTIPAQTLAPDGQTSLDVSPYFRDPDGDGLTYSASSTRPSIATASMSGANLTVTGVADGTATVTVTAADPAGLTATQRVTVTVRAGNRAPETVGTIPAQTLAPDGETSLDVSSYFRDPDGDGLTYSASSNNTAVATASMSGTTLTVAGVAAGSATVTVTAADPDGLTATQRVNVTVGNRAPERVGAMGDWALATGELTTRETASYFRDPDGDALTYSTSTSDSSVVSVSIQASGGRLRLLAVGVGTATITVRATDPDGLWAEQSFRMTVVPPPNRAPETVGTIPAQTVAPDGEASVDVSSYFSDPDGDDLTYSAVSNDTSVATASISGADLTVTGVADGTATVTVTAADPDGLTATQRVNVTVGNRAPERVGAMGDWALATGELTTRETASYFRDPDGDALTYSTSTSDSSVVSVSIQASGGRLRLLAVGVGTATITVRATDPDGLWAEQSARMTVVPPPNRAPETVGTIPAQTLAPTAETSLNVSSYFSDPDGDDLTYSAVSNDTSVATASISGADLTVTGVADGTATVTVTAADPDGLTAAQTVAVTVQTPTNRSPVRLAGVSALIRESGKDPYGTVKWRLADRFRDPDGDPLVYSATSSDTVVAKASIESDTLLVARGEKPGTATATVTATDPDGLTATTTGTWTVLEDIKRIGTIPEQTVSVNAAETVEICAYFTTPSSTLDTRTYWATSNDEETATASIEACTLTITGVAAGTASVIVYAAGRFSRTSDHVSVTVNP